MLSFTADAYNLLNQRAVTAFNTDITSLDTSARRQYLTPRTADPAGVPCSFGSATDNQCFISDGNFFYAAVMRGYNVQSLMNDRRGTGVSSAVNSAYGRPYYFQLARNIRLGVKFSF
jgi:hypothetical protein